MFTFLMVLTLIAFAVLLVSLGIDAWMRSKKQSDLIHQFWRF